jgi:hypothetical protein
MIKFSDLDRPIIGEVYEQMDSMLGLIKDIVEPKDVDMYNLIRVEVEKRWEMLNIPTCLIIRANAEILSYIMAFNTNTWWWDQEKTTPRSRGSSR